MGIPAVNVFELGDRQRAMQVPLRFKGKQVGTLASLQAAQKVRALSPADYQALMQRLEALYRLGFDFGKVAINQDLAEIQMPAVAEVVPGLALGKGVVPGVDIKITGKIKRDSEVREEQEPYFVLKFVYQDPKGQERQVGYFHTLYQRRARSLSLYTCGAVKIDQGRHLPRELIARGFLTAARMARALGEDPVGAFAFYILDWLDFQNREERIIKPAVQDRIDKLFGILKSLGFYGGFPAGARGESLYTGARQIDLKKLEENFRESWWQWAYAERFGPFSTFLDREELRLRFEHRTEEDWRTLEARAKYWLEGEGAVEKLNSVDTPTEDILTIFEDRETSFELGEKALRVIMERGKFDRETMIRMVNVLKRSQFDPARYEDRELKDTFYRHLPKALQTTALRDLLGLARTRK